jgi:SAM-dependent MidA family methyltransferase
MSSATLSLPLATRLREKIRAEGPISFRDWMLAALYDPTEGYYCAEHLTRWGREGDYRTSPERSPLFAATFARYFAELYQKLDSPSAWTILEAGAGNGQFAAGLLTTLRESYPAVFAATSYVIDEVSPASREEISRRLSEFTERVSFSKLEESAIDHGIIFSNELLDALPVHRITKRDGQLLEYFVTLDERDAFVWDLREARVEHLDRFANFLRLSGTELLENQTIEVCLDAEDWLRRAAKTLRSGYLVTVDYGGSSPAADAGTLRGFSRHQFVDDLLAEPGHHDLTANVNWNFVREFGSSLGFESVEFEQQDRFLVRHGLLDQLENETAQCQDEAARMQLRTSVREMILPDGMAAHFQVLVQRKTTETS